MSTAQGSTSVAQCSPSPERRSTSATRSVRSVTSQASLGASIIVISRAQPGQGLQILECELDNRPARISSSRVENMETMIMDSFQETSDLRIDVATIGGYVVGYIRWYQGGRREAASIKMTAVRFANRGRGIGRHFMSQPGLTSIRGASSCRAMRLQSISGSGWASTREIGTVLCALLVATMPR